MSLRRRASGRAHYNYFRDYDPAVGRYVESDPLGLRGGWSTYTYDGGDAISFVDPYGLLKYGSGSSANSPGPGAFHWYGNWGGPGWGAGRWVSECDLTRTDLEVGVKSSRDACYKAHDLCIHNRCHKPCGGAPDFKPCDHQLADCLRKIPPADPSYLTPIPANYEAHLFDTSIPIFVH